MKIFQLRPMGFIFAIILVAVCGAAMAAQAPEVPSQDGGIGPCRADFTVKDGAGKALYDAKINVVLKYGFMNMRKTELEVGTNSDGKARFTGLPNFPKKPLDFHVKSGTVSRTVTDDPSANCNATFDVVLTVHSEPPHN